MVGDVILTLFPYTDLSNAKLRPAVVLAEVSMGDRVLCEITSSLQNRPEYIAITQQDMRTGRLRRASWVRSDRIFTLNRSLSTSTLGRLSDAKQAEISAAVRSLF